MSATLPISDLLPRKDWSGDRQRQFHARCGLSSEWAATTFRYAFGSKKRLRALFIADPDLLDRVDAWHSSVVEMLPTMSRSQFKELFGENTGKGMRAINSHPHLYGRRANLTRSEVSSVRHRTLVPYLVDVKSEILTDPVNWPSPGMTGPLLRAWLEKSIEGCVVPDNVTADDIARGVRGEGVLGEMQGPLSVLAFNAREKLKEKEVQEEWLRLACGDAADAVRLALPMLFEGAPFGLEDQPEIKPILDGLAIVDEKVVRLVIDLLVEAGEVKHAGGSEAYDKLQKAMDELGSSERDPRIMCPVGICAQGFGNGKSRLFDQHYLGHVVLKTGLWKKGRSYVPPDPLDALLGSELEKVKTYGRLKRALRWMVYSVRQKLASLGTTPEKSVTLTVLKHMKEDIESFFTRKNDPPDGHGWEENDPFLWLVLDEVGQRLLKKIRHDELGMISRCDALRPCGPRACPSGTAVCTLAAGRGSRQADPTAACIGQSDLKQVSEHLTN